MSNSLSLALQAPAGLCDLILHNHPNLQFIPFDNLVLHRHELRHLEAHQISIHVQDKVKFSRIMKHTCDMRDTFQSSRGEYTSKAMTYIPCDVDITAIQPVPLLLGQEHNRVCC